MEQQEKKLVLKKWHVAVIVIFMIGFVWSMNGDSKLSSEPAQTTPQNASVSVGENGYIKVASPKAIIALTESGFDELTKTYIANDTNGIYEFLVSGKGFAVPNGTKVLVIDTAVGSRKIRVLEGESNGKAGWIVKEWVSKTK